MAGLDLQHLGTQYRPKVLAIDIGASSGRLIEGYISEDRLYTKELYRFENEMHYREPFYTWNLDKILEHIYKGIRLYADKNTKSLGVDMWGVDYVLVDGEGRLQDIVYAYRDPRTIETMKDTIAYFGSETLYKKTGLQFLQFNTLFQLKAHKSHNPSAFEKSAYFLMLPDYFHFKLSGVFSNEFTEMSTTQLLDSSKDRNMREDLLAYLGISRDLFPPMRMSGDILGPITSETKELTLLDENCMVICPPTHDTASAVISSIGGEDSAYLISGTWSMIGILTEAPICTDKAMEYSFSNEGGAFKTNRLLKNIIGMWIINQVVKEYDGHIEFEELINEAKKVEAFECLIYPNHPVFMNPPSMIEAIQDFTRRTNQKLPVTIGELARCVYDSLALMYGLYLEQLEEITDKQYTVLNVIGGGSKNSFLNQLTANVIQRNVTAGPVETSAIGNIMIQLLSLGQITNLEHVKDVIRNSKDIMEYKPQHMPNLTEVYQRFKTIIDDVHV